LLLAACRPPPLDPPAVTRWTPAGGATVPAALIEPPPLPSPFPEVLPAAPNRVPAPAWAPPTSTAPQPAARLPDAAFSQPFTNGPITGYGPGGMAHEPGTPSNPPWHYGGTAP
jgi:hypothetical protein